MSFNPEMVLSKIWEYQNIRSTTPPSTPIPDTILDRTPHNAKEIVDQGMVLQRRILASQKSQPKIFASVY